MGSPKLFLAAAALAVGLAACAPKPQAIELALSPEFAELQPRMVAVLPFDNMSPDLDATPLVRPIVQERLRARGYRMVELAEVDRVLEQNGVQVSHDVYAFTPEELGDLLGADAVLYGTVTQFGTKYAVVYSSITVAVRLELAECAGGTVLWRDEGRASRNTALETALIFLVEQDLDRALTTVAVYNTAFAVLKSYRPYAEEAAQTALAELPPGPEIPRPYAWDLNVGAPPGDAVEIWMGARHGIGTSGPAVGVILERR